MCERHYRRVLATGSPLRRETGWETRIVKQDDGCWIWQGRPTNAGYGSYTKWNDRTYVAHRYVYEVFKGAIPDGLDLDHLCRVRMCVNPNHLEPVTRSENLRRGYLARTTCRNGHDLTFPDAHREGTNECRLCYRAKWQRVNARRRRERASRPS